MSEDDLRLAFEAGQVAVRAAHARQVLTDLGLSEGHVADHVRGFVERELRKLLAARRPAATTSTTGEHPEPPV